MATPIPGAHTAFKPKAAPAAGIKPQQVGNVKFPGKVKTGGVSTNLAIGAAMAAVAGRIMHLLPGLGSFFASHPSARDATIGATVALALSQGDKQDEPSKHDVYMPRPPVENPEWKLSALQDYKGLFNPHITSPLALAMLAGPSAYHLATGKEPSDTTKDVAEVGGLGLLIHGEIPAFVNALRRK